MSDYMNEQKQERQKKEETGDVYLGIKKRKLDDGKSLIEMPLRFIKYDAYIVLVHFLRFIKYDAYIALVHFLRFVKYDAYIALVHFLRFSSMMLI